MDRPKPAKWKPCHYRRATRARLARPWRKAGRDWRDVTVLAAVWWFLVLPLHSEEPAVPSEPQVKVGFLLNFFKYVEWPDASTNSVLEIIHVGENELGDDVVSLINAKIIAGRPVVLRHSNAPRDWRSGHILFVSDTERRRLPEILHAVKGRPVLTVGESDGFLEKGGMINFVMKGRKVRLAINLTAAEAGGLKLSSRLLAVADTVKRE